MNDSNKATTPTRVLAITAVAFILLAIMALVVIVPSESSYPTALLRRETPSKQQQQDDDFRVDLPGVSIFRPYYSSALLSLSDRQTSLMAPPEQWIAVYEDRLYRDYDALDWEMDYRQEAANAYLEMMKQYLLMPSSSFSSPTAAATTTTKHTLSLGRHSWTNLGLTMTTKARLDNIQHLLEEVSNNGVLGHVLDAGVWRGGTSLYAQAVVRALFTQQQQQQQQSQQKRLFVCDTFHGMPKGDRHLDPRDEQWNNEIDMTVSSSTVAQNFAQTGLLDENVVFCQGELKDTLPALMTMNKHNNDDKEIVLDALSLVRIDVEQYESTVDILYNVYDKVSIGGYVIVDGWLSTPTDDSNENGGESPSETACRDFFEAHHHYPEIVRVDDATVYWKKTKNIRIQQWRYQNYLRHGLPEENDEDNITLETTAS